MTDALDVAGPDATKSLERGGVPPFAWLDVVGEGDWDGSSLRMKAPAMSDWFNSPDGNKRESSAPALVFTPSGDFQLAATAKVDFRSTFDAAVLFVHQTENDYAKLCFERSPDGSPMVVSVVTRVVSDDANGPLVENDSVSLRISRFDGIFAFHYAIDQGPWSLVRLFSLRSPADPIRVGFLAQSPTGEGCNVEFERPKYAPTTLVNERDGS